MKKQKDDFVPLLIATLASKWGNFNSNHLEIKVDNKNDSIVIKRNKSISKHDYAQRICNAIPSEEIISYRCGNTTFVFMPIKESKKFGFPNFIGVAECNKTDDYDEIVGTAIAYLRMTGKKVPDILIK
jgi:hypothetical protein